MPTGVGEMVRNVWRDGMKRKSCRDSSISLRWTIRCL